MGSITVYPPASGATLADFYPAYLPGELFGMQYDPGESGMPSANNTTDNCTFAPLFIHSPVTVDELAIRVGAVGTAGATANIGIYSHDEVTQSPLALLVAVNDIDVVTGGPDIVISEPITPLALSVGWHWTAVIQHLAAPEDTGTEIYQYKFLFAYPPFHHDYETDPVPNLMKGWNGTGANYDGDLPATAAATLLKTQNDRYWLGLRAAA